MKTKSMLLASLAVLALGATRGKAAEVSVSLFYDALEPHGEWIEAADYGYVWTPKGVDADWRPYTNGQWVYTDAGWTWTSEEPYSWAVYHYGRWVNLENVGWSWVPDSEWGPAWVSWRHSDKYVGWAPLPPESRETVRVGVNLGNWVDTYYDIGPTYYSFVEVRNIGAPRLSAVVLPPRENITIINQTMNITKVTVRNNIVVNEGPDYNVIVRQSAQPIRRLKLNREVDIAGDIRGGQADRFRTRIQGDTLSIAAPRIQAVNTKTIAPKKVARRIDTVSVNHGWRDAGDAQKVEAFRTKLQAEAKFPANLPPIQRRDRGERGAAGADRATARTGAETDANSRPGATREGRTPGDASRPTAGTGRNPAEDPNRPTATTDTQDDNRAPGTANRPNAAKRMPRDASKPDATAGTETDSTRPPVGSRDATRPGVGGSSTAPDAAGTDRPGQPDRPGAGQRGKDQRRKGGPAESGSPDATKSPASDTETPDATNGPGAGSRRGERPGAADRPGAAEHRGAGADRPDRPDHPDRPDRSGAERKGPGERPGAAERAGNSGGERPEGAKPPGGADRPDGARAGSPKEAKERGGQEEHNKQGGGGPAGAGANAGGGNKQGHADGDKPKKDKKDGD